jgi:peptidoglycan/xylan/chitin deacetylase (PgdA/CDA1 family)
MWNDTVIEAVRYSTEDQWSDLPGLPVLSLHGEEARKQTADTIIKTIKHLEPGKRLAVVEKLATRVNHLPDNLMMSDQELLDLSHNGVEIGAHTVTHPILTKISPNEVMEEIEEGRSYLANLLGKEIRYFAYPNGRAGQDYDDSHVQLVKTLGFEAAVTTNAGVSTIGTDRFRLARFTPWDKTPFKFYLRMVKNRLSGYGQA